MLTQSEKEKIRSEEIFRQEIKKELEKNHTNRFSFWKFLNSSFTIFFLSSIFLGGLSFFYKQWKENQDELKQDKIKQLENQRTFYKLSEEAIARLAVIERLNDTIPEYKSKNVLLAYWGNSIRNHEELNLKYYNLRPLFIDYEQWTLIELLTELSRYSDSSITEKISETSQLLLENSEDLNGGQLILSKTKQGEYLPAGNLYKQTDSASGTVSWIYVTNQNRKIKLSNNKIPITRYYTASEEQRNLINLVKELKISLLKGKT